MLSHVRNGEAGRLRDVHALGNEELVSYGLAHHIVIADKRNELATELAGRELLRQHHPDVVVSQDRYCNCGPRVTLITIPMMMVVG